MKSSFSDNLSVRALTCDSNLKVVSIVGDDGSDSPADQRRLLSGVRPECPNAKVLFLVKAGGPGGGGFEFQKRIGGRDGEFRPDGLSGLGVELGHGQGIKSGL